MRTLAMMLLLAVMARADVTLHPIFSDNMVLQRDAKVKVWGKAAPGEEVTVALVSDGGTITPASERFTNANATTKADDKGQWSVQIGPLPYVKEVSSYSLGVKGNNTLALKNILLGDVWLCSGQSNMEWKVNQLPKDDQAKKVAEKAANKNLRFFTVPNRPFKEPQSTFPAGKSEGVWVECTPETVMNFSAVGYFFGREIEKTQKVPVGLIASDWGGTPCEAWTSLDGLKTEAGLKHYVDAHAAIDEKKVMDAYEKALAKYKADADKAKAEGKPFTARAPQKPQNGGVGSHTPAALYNGMIAPITNFAIKGAIWYQGESNAGRAKEYRTLYPTMIKDWRKQWGYDFPFFTVQLAPFKADGSDKVSYAELRDAQTFTCTLPKVGMAVITDSGDENDIHPQRKQPAGERLALAARAIAYGEKVEHSGPTLKKVEFEGGSGRAIVTLEHADGLKASGETVNGFQMAGEDKVFHPAVAVIKGGHIEVTCDKVAKPIAVRFGWVNFAKPELNVFNGAGLPMVPFRSDDWPLTTK